MTEMSAMAAAEPLIAGEAKRPFIQRLFTDIAPRYDAFNRLTSCGLDQGWRRAALREGQVGPGQRVLDACAGTGDFALLAAACVGESGSVGRWLPPPSALSAPPRVPAPAVVSGGPGERGTPGLVVGADLNLAMLSRARQKRSRGASVDWLQADTLALPFPAASFDRVTIGFSTRNLVDLDAGLREMVRVLRPGGRLIILETGRPGNAFVRLGYYAYLFTVARAIGWGLTGTLWPFTYLARSVHAFLTPAQMVRALDDSGAPARYLPLAGGLASLFIATKRDG